MATKRRRVAGPALGCNGFMLPFSFCDAGGGFGLLPVASGQRSAKAVRYRLMAEAILDSRRIAKRVTVQVRIKRFTEWRWRLKLGLLLFRLAAWVMWVNIEIVDNNQVKAC